MKPDAVDSLSLELSGAGDFSADILFVNPSCTGPDDGGIVINELNNAQLPVNIKVNELSFQGISNFPFQIPDLGAGNYDIQITDAAGCTLNISDELVLPNNIVVDLGHGSRNNIRRHPSSFRSNQF